MGHGVPDGRKVGWQEGKRDGKTRSYQRRPFMRCDRLAFAGKLKLILDI
jgi:hypothetical protein